MDLVAATIAVTIQADGCQGAAAGAATGAAIVPAERDQVVLDPLSVEQPATPAAERWDVGGAGRAALCRTVLCRGWTRVRVRVLWGSCSIPPVPAPTLCGSVCMLTVC